MKEVNVMDLVDTSFRIGYRIGYNDGELGELFRPQNNIVQSVDTGYVSDGNHTFDELYYHRMVLFSVICNQHKGKAWKSRLHSDGTMHKDYFIVGIYTPQGPFTYHYKLEHWDLFDVTELSRAPEWDGHTSKDVVRLQSL